MHRTILHLLSFFMRIAMVVRSIGNRFRCAAFVRGMGSVLSIGGGKDHYANPNAVDPADADAKAIAGDWVAVGDDIRTAMRSYESSEGGVGRG